jgi:hypothetical protein
MPVQVGVGYVDIKPDLSGFSRQLKGEVDRGVSAAGTSAGRSLKASLSSAMKGAAAGLAAVGVTNFLGGAIDAASSFNETLSKSNAVFKGNAAGVEAWAKGAADNIGLSTRAALDAASGFGNMFVQLGIGGDEAARMSEKIVELGVDFRSFSNANIEDVLAAQSAAFRGEYDSLQRFLPLISAATVEQRALAITGKRTTKELTAQDKALAVNALMFEGAGDALGDYERTQDSLANQQQRTTALWEDAKVELGTGLIPVMTGLAGVLNDHLIPAFKTLFLSEGADPTGWAATIRDVIGDTVGFLFQAFADISRVLANIVSAIPGGWGEGAADNLRAVADSADGAAVNLHASTAELLAWGAAAKDAKPALLALMPKGWLPELKGVTAGTKDSAAALRDHAKASRDAAGADRDLRDARTDLAKLLADGPIDEEKIADARETLADATRGAARAERELVKAQREYDQAAAAADILGTDTALDAAADAADNLADAQDSVTDAQEAASDAARDLHLAQAGDPEYQDKLADARDRVADADDKVAASITKIGDAAKVATPLVAGLNGELKTMTLGQANEIGDFILGTPEPNTPPNVPLYQPPAGTGGGSFGPSIPQINIGNIVPPPLTTVQVDMTVLGPAPDPALLGKAIAWVL